MINNYEQHNKRQFESKVVEVCKNNNVDPKIFMAIITVESSWDAKAIRYESSFSYIKNPEFYAKKNHITVSTEVILQKCSFGLGQIMGGTARDLGFDGKLISLVNVYRGTFWAAKYFATRCQKYSELTDQIAAYNAGSPRKNEGKYVNQTYVDKVLNALKD